MPAMRLLLWLLISLLAFGIGAAPVWADGDPALFKGWIEAMKTAPRGPFKRIRWFCNDGEVLAPEPYACQPHGGGIQHGQWNDHTLRMRAAGYPVANVLAEYGRDADAVGQVDRDLLKAILVERFLVARDNGWIFRKARFYRGALQREDEARGESALVRHFALELDPDSYDYLLLWEATRLLSEDGGVALLVKLRDLATAIHEQDEGFATLRGKLHAAPSADDAEAVRDYAQAHADDQTQPLFDELAATIDAFFDPGPLTQRLRKTARHTISKPLRSAFLAAAKARQTADAAKRLADGRRLLELLRRQLVTERSAQHRESLLRTGQEIEKDVFAAGSELRQRLAAATRRQRIDWLLDSAGTLYGVGLLSPRQWQGVQQSVQRLRQPRVNLNSYRQELRYLGRVPRWSARLLDYQFDATIEKFSRIEPLARQYIPARLRGSVLSFYSVVLDSLQRDADRLAGVSSELFATYVSHGLRALNSGMARGRLLRPEAGKPLAEDSIYLLAETTAELTPVAGIITLDEGNALSHVQLLAANLGIPNVIVSPALLPRLRAHLGEQIVLAVSPGGVVQIARDGPQWDGVFERNGVPDTPLRPDRGKLDLDVRQFIPLQRLRAVDSGVIVGPKAANLGELKHFFPAAVADGVAIPFGRFRAFLDRPMGNTGMTVFEWMTAWYRYLDTQQGEAKAAATLKYLKQLHGWIERADPGEDFRRQLSTALQQVFGDSEQQRLFVRSDTNVEDLPGFTGAGLNLTVPNVVGMDALIRAIMRVWASPFTPRAFEWRQQRMENPIEVYPSVLLLETVAVDKSGVLLTFNRIDGSDAAFTVAVAHGIGGVVQGSAAEELLIDRRGGGVRLLNVATRPTMRVTGADGGLVEVPAPNNDRVLTDDEIRQLRQLVDKVERDLPQFDDQGKSTPADIEFGFRDGQLALFQIRPYLRSRSARRNQYLLRLDSQLALHAQQSVNMNAVPEVE